MVCTANRVWPCLITRGRVSQVGVLQEMDLGSIFGLLISVGFPKVSVSSHHTYIHVEDMNHILSAYQCIRSAVSTSYQPSCPHVQLPREGSVLCKVNMDGSTTRAILCNIKPSGDTLQGLAVDLSTRESKSVKLAEYEVEDTLKGCMEVSRLLTLIPLLKASLQLSRQGGCVMGLPCDSNFV